MRLRSACTCRPLPSETSTTRVTRLALIAGRKKLDTDSTIAPRSWSSFCMGVARVKSSSRPTKWRQKLRPSSMRAASSSKAGSGARRRIIWTRIKQRGQRGIQVVRRARRHFSHAGELFDLQHPPAPLDALADVGGHLQEVRGPGGLAERQQAELHFERLAGLRLPHGFHVEHRLARSHPPHEFLQLAALRGGHDGERLAADLRPRIPVHALGGSVPFQHAQAGIVENDGSREGFQQAAVALARAAQVLLAFAPLPRDEPCGPEGQDERGGDAARDVQVVKREVIGVAEEAVIDQFPGGKHERHNGDAGKCQSRPKPPLLTHRRRGSC